MLPQYSIAGGQPPALKVAYLNVAGATGHRSHLVEYVADHDPDIVCMGETWLTEHTQHTLALPGYAATHVLRPQQAAAQGRPSGGVSVFIRHGCAAAGQASVLGDGAAGIAWVTLPAARLVIAACYFSPQGSTWRSQHGCPFATTAPLMTGLAHAHGKGLHTIILGDLNARTGCLTTDIPDDLADAHGTPMHDLSCYAGVPHLRTSLDADTNIYGRELLSLLQASGLVLLNGRAPGDVPARLTFHARTNLWSASVIDVACASAQLFGHVQQLHVAAPLPDVSDHSLVMLHLALDLAPTASAPNHTGKTFRPDVADGKAMDAFKHAFADCEPGLHTLLPRLQASTTPIDAGFAELTRILQDCSTRARPPRPPPCVPTLGAPWWDDECHTLMMQFRAAYRESLRMRDFERLHAGLMYTPSAACVAARTEALRLRNLYNRLKRHKRAAAKEREERALIEQYFSRNARRFWQHLAPARPPAVVGSLDTLTSHFQELLGTPHTSTLTPDQAQHKAAFLQAVSPHGSQLRMAALNAPITDVEVLSAMKSLQSGKAADADGMTGECLRAAWLHYPSAPSFLPCLVHLLQECHKHQLPAQLQLSKLTPVPKGGSPTQYRGIAVSSIFSKLLDIILYRRGNAISEQLGLRAVTQCGFRPGQGTTDALFTLSHLVDHARHARKFLYACFVDFEKAFDSVSRVELLARCRRLGMHGAYVDLIARTYEHVRLAVSANGQRGATFDTHCGTKQGSELSPLMFGWFIEQLHELIVWQHPTAGPVMDGMHVPDIMYADDVSMLALEDPEQMQSLLDALRTFSTLFGIRVNLGKTKYMVFGSGRQAPPPVRLFYGEHELARVPELRCLGVWFHETRPLFHSHAPHAVSAGNRAMFALLARCKHNHIQQPDMRCRLFNALVEPVLSYGCQIWGPTAFYTQWQRPLDNIIDAVQLGFLRMGASLPKHVSKQCLLFEFGQSPIMHHWIVLAARQWGKFVALSPHHNRLAYHALQSDLQLMISGCRRCWSHAFLHTMVALGLTTPAAVATLHGCMQLRFKEGELKKALHAHQIAFLTGVHTLPRSAPSTDVTISTYRHWVGMRQDQFKKAPHMKQHMPHPLRQLLLRFRLGCPDLHVHRGRMQRPKVPRHQRLCTVHAHLDSDTTAVEDLVHFLFECPAYTHIRRQTPYISLFRPAWDATTVPQGVRALFMTRNQRLLAECLQCMMAHRAALMAGDLSVGPLPDQVQERWGPDPRADTPDDY